MLREQLHGLVDVESFQKSIPYLVQSIASDFSIYQEDVDPNLDISRTIVKNRKKLNFQDQIVQLDPATPKLQYRIEMNDFNFGEYLFTWLDTFFPSKFVLPDTFFMFFSGFPTYRVQLIKLM